jgi:hypothetical protein
MLAGRLGLPVAVQRHFGLLTERWDGKGGLGRARGDGVPLALRITHVARDAAFQQMLGGVDHAAQVVGERAGHAFDPEIARLLTEASERRTRRDGRLRRPRLTDACGALRGRPRSSMRQARACGLLRARS